MNPVIKVVGLGKKYILGHERQRQPYLALRDVLTDGARNLGKRLFGQQDSEGLKEEFWALKDVSFAVNQGDRLGIIGRNGAGKSTLLKILSRITEPTTGSVRIKGRVASLLEVGTGFHPELTGRENIFLNGAILGMKRAEIIRKFDEIVEFAEIEKFLDTPVKRYSSGMYVRLAFAVAAHLEPEILIVDEVLAVGDAQFQKKCLGKMEDVSTREGRTVLFVSHHMAAIKALCKTAVYLDAGRIEFMGDSSSVVNRYLNVSRSDSLPYHQFDMMEKLPIQLISACVLDSKDALLESHPYDEPYKLNIRISVREKVSNVYLAAHIHDSELQTIVFTRDFESEPRLLLEREPGEYTYVVNIPPSLLVPGSYSISVHMAYSSPPQFICGADNICPFELIDNGSQIAKVGFPWRGKVALPLHWGRE